MSNQAGLVSNRREFIKGTVLGSALLACGQQRLDAAVVKANRQADSGLKLGIASYTFRKFSLDKAIEMTRQAGLSYISLKDVHLPFSSTPEQRKAAREQIQNGGLTLVSVGVIYMKNNEADLRKLFDYAKDAGAPTIVASPDIEALDSVEKLAVEYNLRIAIHNHGPGDKKYPSPLDVLRLVKDRDPRMGICIDVGHTVRLGLDPVETIQECAARLYDFHIKDETEAKPGGKPTEVGRGVIDIVGVLKALKGINYENHVGLEYEAHENDPLPGVTESVGYIRGALAALD